MDIAQLDDDSKMLGFYSVTSGMFIHVTDVDPHSISKGGALENVNLVERYRMDEETHDKRKGTVREWIRNSGPGPGLKPPQMPGAQMANAKTKALPCTGGGRRAHCRRVAVRGPARRRRGCVVLWGARRERRPWVGGELLDDPLGKNYGSAGTVRHHGAENHGTFAKPTNVACGDLSASSTTG